MKTRTLLYTFDRALRDIWRAHFASLLEHWPETPGEDIRVLIVSNDLKPGDIPRQSRGDVFFEIVPFVVPLDPCIVIPTEGNLTSVNAFARMYLERFLPEDIERVLYLDSDMVVLDDLRPLYDADIGDNIVGACCDLYWFWQLSSLRTSYVDKTMNAHQQPYFNSGVMVIDVPRWRENKTTEKADAVVKARWGTLRHVDQDVLNVALRYRWGRLPQRWNVISMWEFMDKQATPPNIYKEVRAAMDDPAIIHFAGLVKPWHPAYRGYGKREWKRYQVGWGDPPFVPIQKIFSNRFLWDYYEMELRQHLGRTYSMVSGEDWPRFGEEVLRFARKPWLLTKTIPFRRLKMLALGRFVGTD